MKYSIVIPVFNSEGVVLETVEGVSSFFNEVNLTYEIVLVNDGSTDNSWEVLKSIAEKHSSVIAINLSHNYGQQHANLCGLKHSVGEWVVTMDDDLQNPPKEISKFIERSKSGATLIVGKFKQKKHPIYRRIGSYLFQKINRRIFQTPINITLTNFRLIHRSVVDKICECQAPFPYISGLAVLFSHSIENVEVEHHSRQYSQSSYSFFRLLKLVYNVWFGYSAFPLRVVSVASGAFALLSFLSVLFFLSWSTFFDISPQTFPLLTVLFFFFSGIIFLILSILAEYLILTIKQTSFFPICMVREVIRSDD